MIPGLSAVASSTLYNLLPSLTPMTGVLTIFSYSINGYRQAAQSNTGQKPSFLILASKDVAIDNLARLQPLLNSDKPFSSTTMSSSDFSLLPSPSTSWPLTRLHSPSNPSMIPQPDTSLSSSATPTQILHFTYVSIHIACSANALALGCTAEKCIRTGYNNPFNQPLYRSSVAAS